MTRIPLILATLLLAACSSIRERQDNALQLLKDVELTASGAANQAGDLLQKGKSAAEGVGDMMNDAKRRFDQVEEGVDLMMQGKDMIQEGMD